MSGSDGPWGRLPPVEPVEEPPRRSGFDPRRLAMVLALIGGVGVGVWALNRLLPGQVTSQDDWTDILGATLVLTIVSTGLFASRGVGLGRKLRYAAIWVAIFAMLVLVYVYRKDFMAVGDRVRAELLPSHPVAVGPRALAITQSEDGGYYIMGKVEGVTMRFLIDTGASDDVVLSPDDARRLGVTPDSLKFERAYETANGVGLGARLGPRRLEVGPIRLDAVPVSVNQAAMSSSILGRGFLRRLDGFEARGGKLILRWKG